MTRRVADAIETGLLWCVFQLASLIWPVHEVDG